MKRLPEKDYHELFRIGILVKAVDGIIEAVGGAVIYFANYATLNRALLSIFRGEVAESPHDLVWGYLINEWHHFLLSSHAFWGILFIVHGGIKIFLSAMLLRGYLWAYPAGVLIFGLFAGYEYYSAFNQSSPFLWAIGSFDVIVVGLILHEYRHIKKHRTNQDTALF